MMSDPEKDTLIRRRIIIGTTSNFVGQLFVFFVLFLLTPFILSHVGDADYGLWILLGSIVAYSSLLDFGMWGTVIKYVAEYQAQKNYEDARALLSTVLYLYIGIAMLISLAGLATAPFVPSLFNLAPEQHELTRRLVVLISLSTGFAIPCMLPLAVLRGLQRYDITNGIDIFTTLFTTIATVIVLLYGGGVTGMAFVNLGSIFLSLFASLWMLHKVAPELHFRLRGANWSMARKIAGYSWPLFMRDMATRLQTRTDEITIGIFLPVSAVGSYSLARRLSETTQTLTRQFMKTLLPLASQLHAEDDFPRLRHLYKTGTRLTIAIVLALSSVLIVLAGPILAVWVGTPYAAYTGVVVILTLANLIATVQWPAMAILQAMTRHRILAFSSLGNGIANLILSVLLVRAYGLIGVALGTAIPIAIEYFGVVLPYSLRVTKIPLREASLELFLPALLPAVPTFLILYSLRFAFEPSSLLAILVVATAGLCVYVVTYLSIVGNQIERQWIMALAANSYRLLIARKKQIH